jgi:hypothetical protein
LQRYDLNPRLLQGTLRNGSLINVFNQSFSIGLKEGNKGVVILNHPGYDVIAILENDIPNFEYANRGKKIVEQGKLLKLIMPQIGNPDRITPAFIAFDQINPKRPLFLYQKQQSAR